MEQFEGRFSDFFETGTEGSLWALERFGLSGYEALVLLQSGDEIEVYDPSGTAVYSGIIEPDHNGNRMARLSGRQQPTSNGRWVHWIQAGVDPGLWGSWFFGRKYSGILVRRRRSY